MMESFSGARQDWNDLISHLPEPHFLQTWEWAQVKAKYGWKPLPFIWRNPAGAVEAAAMILSRQVIKEGLAARLSILYTPKGPLLDWSDEELQNRVLDEMQSFARKRGAIFLKIDPELVLGRGIPGSENASRYEIGQRLTEGLIHRGWVYSTDQIQFQNTVLVDLAPSEQELLARMKQKTRYNIRLAEKKGVVVRTGDLHDLPRVYKMYAETSVRDGFVIRDENYYLDVWRTFIQGGQPTAQPLIAEVEGEPVAALFLFMFAGRAYYVYGMSRAAHREKMPTYLLQWEAMKRAKANGCSVYDLWGAPQVFDESDPMWGVYRFKEGLGGGVVRTLGAYDFAPSRLWYRVYAELVPHLLDFMRLRGKEKTRRIIGGA